MTTKKKNTTKPTAEKRSSKVEVCLVCARVIEPDEPSDVHRHMTWRKKDGKTKTRVVAMFKTHEQCSDSIILRAKE